MEHKILGIGGVSRSGKTTLASILSHSLSNKKYEKIKVVAQDEYTLPEEQIPTINGRTDWEDPKSINWDLLISDVKNFQKENDLVIVEGIFAYYHEELNGLYDFAVFLTIRKDVFMQRKMEDPRWGEEPEWYVKHIWQSYLSYGLPNIPVIELEGSNMWVVDKVIEKVGF